MEIQNPKSKNQNPEVLLLVGRVGKTHGLRGEVKVIPETDDPKRFADLETVFLGNEPGEATPHTVAAVRLQPTRRGPTVVLKLEGIDTIEEAASLRRQRVFAREEDLPPLADGEFFLHDLIGLDVVTDQGEPVGTVKDVLELPANNVYVVARSGRPDTLIPAVPAFIDEMDIEGRRLVVRPIEGLLD